MSNSSTLNGDISNATCFDLIVNGVTPQPDNDISGIGIIVSFVASAYITFILVVTAYIGGHVDQGLLRPVDTLVHKRKGCTNDRDSNMVVLIRQTVLSFSDQQIVTGIAILIAGFARFWTAMNVYHFQMVIYLAWMSSSTHLSALTMLSGFLRERRLLLAWRIVGMLCLFALLLVAMIPTWPNLWAVDVTEGDLTSGWGVPAPCFWLRTYGAGINPDAPIGSIILLTSYIWKVGSIFHSSRTFFHRWVRGPAEYFLERLVRHEARRFQTTGSSWRYRLAVAAYAITVSNFEFCSSFAASLWLSFGGLAWGTIQVLVPRLQNDWWAWQENSWTFGQVTPLVLLVQPLGSVLEHLHKRRDGYEADDASEVTEVELESNASGEPRGRFSLRLRRRSRSRWTPSKTSRKSTTARRTMSEVFANLEIRSPEDRTIGDLPGHQRIMYNSKYFRGLFWWIQFFILCAIGLTCGWDGAVMGDDTSTNWLWLISSILLILVLSACWSLACMPWSRVFR